MQFSRFTRHVPGFRQYLLSGLLGAAMVLSFAPFQWFWLQFVLLAFLVHTSIRATNARQAFLLGLTFGLGQYLCGLTYVLRALHEQGDVSLWLSVLMFAALATILALFHAIFSIAAYLMYRAHRPAIVWIAATASVWALLEWLRSFIFTGFPWLSLGYAHIDWVLKYWAQIGGVIVVGFWVMWMVASLLAWQQRRDIKMLVPTLAPVMGALLISLCHWTWPSGKNLSVALLQGNHATTARYRSDGLATAQQAYEALLQQPLQADVIVFPEDAMPLPFQDIPADFLESLRRSMQRSGGDMLLGAAYWLDLQGRYAFSVLHLPHTTTPSQWTNPARYDKAHLIPFAEYMPAWTRWLKLGRLDIPNNTATPGNAPNGLFYIKSMPIAVSLCYEFLFGNEIRRHAHDAQLIMNLGNNAWFEHSVVLDQGQQISRMRAIETGRSVVRVDNVGLTGIIDAFGVQQERLAPYQASMLQATVEGRAGSTPYARWGELPWVIGWLCLVIQAGWRPVWRAIVGKPLSLQ